MPISSTHVALGGVFGVGFLREFLDQRMGSIIENVLEKHEGDKHFDEVARVLHDFKRAPVEEKQRILDQLAEVGEHAVITAAQQRKLNKILKRQLVKRSHLLKIVSAWLITVPASALLSVLFFFALRGMMLP